MGSQELGKFIIFLGIGIVVLGAFVYFFKGFGFLGKLPGDFRVEKENFSFYFPLGTSILISILLSLIFYIISRFR